MAFCGWSGARREARDIIEDDRTKVLDGKRNALVKEFGQEARVVVIKKKEQFEKYAANQENKRKTHVNKILALLADSL